MKDKKTRRLKWETKLQKTKNSYCVIIPKIMLKKMGLNDPKKAVFKIYTDGYALLLTPIKKRDKE